MALPLKMAQTVEAGAGRAGNGGERAGVTAAAVKVKFRQLCSESTKTILSIVDKNRTLDGQN